MANDTRATDGPSYSDEEVARLVSASSGATPVVGEPDVQLPPSLAPRMRDQIRSRTRKERFQELWAAADKMRADAEQRSRELLQEAERKSAELVSEARAEAERTRRESERELALMARRREAMSAQLQMMQEASSTLGARPVDAELAQSAAAIGVLLADLERAMASGRDGVAAEVESSSGGILTTGRDVPRDRSQMRPDVPEVGSGVRRRRSRTSPDRVQRSFYLSRELVDRARAAVYATSRQPGEAYNLSELAGRVLLDEVSRLEQQYNRGRPFPSVEDVSPRPGSAGPSRIRDGLAASPDRMVR